MSIARDRIVDEALKLLDEVGIEALTTRKIAERLGVQQPALYWHFKNKRALLDAMNDAMMAPYIADSLPATGDDWRSFLFRYGSQYRRALLSRRQGGAVHAGSPPADGDDDRRKARLAFLATCGFSQQMSMEAVLALHHYVLGSVMDEQADKEAGIGWDQFANASEYEFGPELIAIARLGREHVFLAGLEMLLDGLELRLSRRPK